MLSATARGRDRPRFLVCSSARLVQLSASVRCARDPKPFEILEKAASRLAVGLFEHPGESRTDVAGLLEEPLHIGPLILAKDMGGR